MPGGARRPPKPRHERESMAVSVSIASRAKAKESAPAEGGGTYPEQWGVDSDTAAANWSIVRTCESASLNGTSQGESLDMPFGHPFSAVSESKRCAPENVTMPSSSSQIAANVRAVRGGTSSDHRRSTGVSKSLRNILGLGGTKVLCQTRGAGERAGGAYIGSRSCSMHRGGRKSEAWLYLNGPTSRERREEMC